MHTWKTASRPTPLTQGHLHVDSDMKIWEWIFTGSEAGWKERPSYSLKKVREQTIYLRSTPSTTTSLVPSSPGQLKNDWDKFHLKSFIEVQILGNSVYITGLTWAQFTKWLLAYTPKNAGSFTQNPVISVYEVFEQGDYKIIAYNSMYASARGAGAYNRKWGRLKAGLAESYGADPSFTGGYWAGGIAEPGADCLESFFGIPSGTISHPDSARVFWFPVSHHGLYRQPRSGSSVRIPAGSPRWALNADTLTYEQTATGVSHMFVLGEPKFMWMDSDPSNRALWPMVNLRGASLITKKLRGVLVYPLQSGPYRAIFMKPLGVDTLGIGRQVNAEWKVVAEYVYSSGERHTSHRFVTIPATQDASWDEWDEMHRIAFHENVGIPNVSWNTSVDDPRIPEHIQFYALHLPTGRRTEIFSRRLRIIRRRNNISMCIIPELTR